MPQSHFSRPIVTSHPADHTYVPTMIMRILCLCLLLVSPGVVGAQTSNAVPDDVMQLSVLPGWRTEKGTHMAALRIQLKPGWKTYWRAPGEGGIPPQFDWTGSNNIGAVQMHWPRPKISYPNGLRTIGYTEQVIIPIEFIPQSSGQPIRVKGRVDLGVCNDICVPMSAAFSSPLPAAATKPDPLIRTALNKRPLPANKAGVKGVTCAIEPISDG